jgi:hypothetical protein
VDSLRSGGGVGVGNAISSFPGDRLRTIATLKCSAR